MVVETHYGFGRHEASLTTHQIQEFKKYAFGEWIQTFATLMWTKVSICLFLLRIPVQPHFVRPLQAALVFLILSNVVLTILWIAQCRPIDAAWNDSIHGKCFSKRQKECIIFAQASKLRNFFTSPPKFSFGVLLMSRALRSYLCCLRFLVCCMADSAFMEPPNQIEIQSGPVLPDGIGRSVRDIVHHSMMISRPPPKPRYSTGSCCIVRTVLNGGSLPDDVTCGLPLPNFVEVSS